MLLGIAIKGWMLVAGGATLFLLVVFQVLVGLRKIKFKGKLHLQVHKVGAYALLGITVFHALAALAFLHII
jgi:cytochrome b561